MEHLEQRLYLGSVAASAATAASAAPAASADVAAAVAVAAEIAGAKSETEPRGFAGEKYVATENDRRDLSGSEFALLDAAFVFAASTSPSAADWEFAMAEGKGESTEVRSQSAETPPAETSSSHAPPSAPAEPADSSEGKTNSTLEEAMPPDMPDPQDMDPNATSRPRKEGETSTHDTAALDADPAKPSKRPAKGRLRLDAAAGDFEPLGSAARLLSVRKPGSGSASYVGSPPLIDAAPVAGRSMAGDLGFNEFGNWTTSGLQSLSATGMSGGGGVNGSAGTATTSTVGDASAADGSGPGPAAGMTVSPQTAVFTTSTTFAGSEASSTASSVAFEPITVKYDFRDQNGFANLITREQQARAVDALAAWSQASGGRFVFVLDTAAPATEILNIGTGDLAAFGYASGAGGTISLGGGTVTRSDDGEPIVSGVAWLDYRETWDTFFRNGNPGGTFDYFTVVAHETGHALGLEHTSYVASRDIMSGIYGGERTTMSSRDVAQVVTAAESLRANTFETTHAASFHLTPMTTGAPQLTAADVEQLLSRAAAASASDDAIIAVVDRGGNILGVRTEAGVPTANLETLVFSIDGAVAKARTAAFFANDTAPLTSRLVRFISQSTVTQREVESNPNSLDPTVRGPGFVAPIGVGGHFPPEIMHTPPVDLFAIEHTNRDSLLHPGADRIKGTADDILLPYRFNIDPSFVPAGNEIDAPESYGFVSGLMESAQSRGIATLPGGVPLFRDTNGDGIGDTHIGGIGVFFPGPDGYATHEQGFVPGVGQTEFQRTNAPRVLEAEFIALAAAGGSLGAERAGAPGAKVGAINGVAPVPGLDVPFGRLDLVGIQLQVFGPIAGIEGTRQLVQFGRGLGAGDPASGSDQPVGPGGDLIPGTADDVFYNDGESVAAGWLVLPQDSAVDNLTADDVQRIINQGIAAAEQVRAAVRLPLSSRTRMVFAVTDTSGEVLGLYRMPDATVFSIDVAVAKARNTAYYADASALQPEDQAPGVPAGVAFSNRTFRFLAEPRFPSGVDGSAPPPFSILNDPGINPRTAENLGAPTPASAFSTVLGFDAFNPNTNFRDPDDIANQNGVVFFPGSSPLYKNGQLVGGLGVSGDGVDQDDVVTFVATQGYLPPPGVLRADQVRFDDVRLPYIKFLRNPFG